MKHLPFCVFAGSLFLALAGCHQAAQPTPTDGGLSDAVVLPDLDILPEDAGAPAQLGAPCGAMQRCADELVCLALPRGPADEVRLCVLPRCVPEDMATAEREDSCPEDSACAIIHTAVGAETFCVPTCEPEADDNPCAAIHPEVACDPLSVLLTGNTPVCAMAACRSDAHCGRGDSFDPEVRCDVDTGVCFGEGRVDGNVGASCRQSDQCGAHQLCLMRTPAGELVDAGYCTIIGCGYGGPWTCPEGSGCFSIGGPSVYTLCLALGCDPAAAAGDNGCREDQPTAYACIRLGDEAVCFLAP